VGFFSSNGDNVLIPIMISVTGYIYRVKVPTD
jgi:hypothetical protein